MADLHLYMILLGCRPKGRFTEQHDIFFGIGRSLAGLVPAIKASWPEAKGAVHIDAWRKITQVADYAITVSEKADTKSNAQRLFFINLGGYKPGEFDEFHYKIVVVAANKAEAIQQAKQTAFYRHTGFKGATSHIDDKYGIDVDDAFEIKDILSDKRFQVTITPHEAREDPMQLGYLKLEKIKD